ncbi:response regulator [Aeoliella mucimassa]|uniref:Transcriptional regulatory protein ZraR n=1 Tax=Aeoliella mucimassa TaxID=2527972 RepID=A0A518AHK6_9BACT|nr:response regulator [Aeoliella mucimassa]QDU54202.1 Transcriptional regulatory protein ZraR [Aeoliella mucimassa]
MTDILFVDDQPEELADLEKSLRKFRQDWYMEFAQGGAEALKMIKARGYDAVVTDLDMPDVSGPALLKEVQKYSPQTVRILLSYRRERTQAVESTSVAHQHLAKPCDVDLLEMAINDALALRYHMDSHAIRDLVGRVDHLPTLPDTYLKLVEELDSPQSSLARVGDIVRNDVAITAKILQLVNSSYFGLPVHVSDISHAVALLGVNVVKPLVLSSGLFEQFSPGSLGQFSLPTLIEHSAEVAMASRCISQLEGAVTEDCDDAFMAGMLHDLGQVVLASNFTAQYDELRAHALETETPLHELELAEFQASHADLGAYLLGLWGLPASIVEAIVWHHTPYHSTHDRFTPLAAVHAAECLLGANRNPMGEASEISHEFLDRFHRNERIGVWSAALGTETAATE